MARVEYVREALGVEVAAPSGYYLPLEEGVVEFEDRRVLYTMGSACIESSCCGVGSWGYLRVEGYLVDGGAGRDGETGHLEIDTVDDQAEKASISGLLAQKHPGIRIEFR